MNRIIGILLLSLAVWSATMSQTPNDQPKSSRDVSVFMSVGYLELIGAGFLVQMSDQYSLGLLASGFAVSERGFIFPHAALGLGFRGSYYFSRDGKSKFLWANAITADVQYLLPRREGGLLSMNNPGGVGIEAVIGRDALVGPGIGILWGVGIAGAFYSEAPPLVMPAFRFGFHIDI